MKLTANGRRLIQGFEGLSLKAYRDADGYSIGYGHYGAKAGDVITQAEAERLFEVDIAKYEAAVSLTTPRAEPHQFDAMTCLCYNIGTAGFAGSTVARLHNMGDIAGAADAFLLWNKSTTNGVRSVNPVLVKRREQERAVYLNGYAPYGGSSEPRKPAGGSASSDSVAGKAAVAGLSAGALTLAALLGAVGLLGLLARR